MNKLRLIIYVMSVFLFNFGVNIFCENLGMIKKEVNCDNSKVLIAYFSCDSSNTIDQLITTATPKIDNNNKLAEMIQTEIGGKLFPIITVEKYPNDYISVVNLAKIEKKNNSRPKLAEQIENITSYDVVVLIFPNWWSTMPMPVFSFLESYDLSGKTIIPICTHGGGGMGNAQDDIKKLCPNSEVKNGLAIYGNQINQSREKIFNFLKNKKTNN